MNELMKDQSTYLDKVNLPGVVTGRSSIPNSGVTSFGGRQHVSASTPFRRALLFHTLLVVPLAFQALLTFISGFVFESDANFAISLVAFGGGTVLQHGGSTDLQLFVGIPGQELVLEVSVVGFVFSADGVRGQVEGCDGHALDVDLNLVVDVSRGGFKED